MEQFAPLPSADDGSCRGFELEKRDFAEVLASVGLWGFPRAFGTPGQSIVWTPDEFFAWWENHREKGVPLFAGHNAFVPVVRSNSLLDRTNIVFRSAFGDFDTGDGLNLPVSELLSDVQRTEHFLIERNISHAWLASGSISEGKPAGFHAVVFFRREEHPRRYLERWENGFWRGLKNELKVRSINIKCANPVALRRIPFSRYVHRKDPTVEGYKAEANYCVPVPYEWVANGEWDRIVDVSFHPTLLPDVRYESGLPEPSLESWVTASGWGTFAHQPMELHPGLEEPPKGSAADLVRLYIPERLCLQTLIFGPNPRHVIRVAWAQEMLAVGHVSGRPLGLEEFVQIVFAVGREARWEDFDEAESRRQATYIWQRPYALRTSDTGEPLPPNPHPYSCRKLREEGACIGSKCRLFRYSFHDEWMEKEANGEVGGGVSG